MPNLPGVAQARLRFVFLETCSLFEICCLLFGISRSAEPSSDPTFERRVEMLSDCFIKWTARDSSSLATVELPRMDLVQGNNADKTRSEKL